MLSLNRTTIDYLSLDVEGHEYDVLDAVPWDRLTVRALTVEYPDLQGDARQRGIQRMVAYMQQRGYTHVGQFDEAIPERDLWNRDLLFVKR